MNFNKLFTLDIPECQELKTIYDKCYSDWLAHKDSFQRMDELQKCELPFKVRYLICIYICIFISIHMMFFDICPLSLIIEL